MDEDPKQHDFDQRHDGPFDQPSRPSVQIPRPSTSPGPSGEAPSPVTSLPRKSMQLPRPSTDQRGRRSVQIARGEEMQSPSDQAGPGRKSTQLSRATQRQSRDFDVRRDGPYGRPSLTMSRRRSSGIHGIPDPADQADEHGEDGDRSPITDEPLPMVEPAFEPEPPPLNYSLQPRRRAILIFWSLILIDCIAMPVGLYFGLHYGTSLSPNVVFSIVTASLGGVSIVEYFVRFWRLFKHNSTCRVIGARRMYLDWFHWNFSFGWVIIMIELIVGTVPEYPPIRLLAMPVTSMLYVFGTELLVVDCLRYFEVPAPVRISSIPKGAQLRPGIYSVIEDVCAVDGNGGTAFREALNKRYEASHVFRAMLRRLGAFWAFGAELFAVIMTILIFTIESEAAYVVGWAGPFVWAGVWAAITYFYVTKKLKEEKQAWSDEIAEKASTAA